MNVILSDKVFTMTESSFSSHLSTTEAARRIFKASKSSFPGQKDESTCFFISAAAVYLLLFLFGEAEICCDALYSTYPGGSKV